MKNDRHHYAIGMKDGIEYEPIHVTVTGEPLPHGQLDAFVCAHSSHFFAAMWGDERDFELHVPSHHSADGSFLIESSSRQPEEAGLRSKILTITKSFNTGSDYVDCDLAFQHANPIDEAHQQQIVEEHDWNPDWNRKPSWTMDRHRGRLPLLFLGCIQSGLAPDAAAQAALASVYATGRHPTRFHQKEIYEAGDLIEELARLGIIATSTTSIDRVIGPSFPMAAGMADEASLERARTYGAACLGTPMILNRIAATFLSPAILEQWEIAPTSAHERLDLLECLEQMQAPMRDFKAAFSAAGKQNSQHFREAILARVPNT